MKKNVPDLEKLIRGDLESEHDFIAIRWADPFARRQSMVRFELQNKKKPRAREWDNEKEHYRYYWPGLSAAKCLKLIKSYSWAQRESENFFCVYRTNFIDDLEDLIITLIPEENLERV